MDLSTLTISQLHQDYLQGKYSVTELVKAYLSRIKKYNPLLNAYLTISDNYALEQARILDSELRNKQVLIKKYPLFGVPIALKDLYLTKGIRTTAGSKVLEDYIPQYSSTAWERLREAGAILLGKTNLDQWGYGGSGENSDFGPTKNPWDQTRVAGGTSSGSAAAVASDLCLVAGGTDTGGSIRNPSSFCGVVGLKPTYGRVSRYGIIAQTPSFDSIGHLSKSVWDCAKYLEVTAGNDSHDATTPKNKVLKYTEILSRSFNLNQVKIGIPQEYFIKGIDQDVENSVKQAIKTLAANGARVKQISLPHTEYGVPTYYIIVFSETSSNRGRYDGIRFGHDRTYFTDEAKRRIMLGTFSLSAGYYDAYYKKATKVRTLIKKDFEDAFKRVDVIITPVMPTPAFKFGERQDPLQMYLADIFTAPINLSGVPGLAVPCGFSKNKLPIGMQIIGPHFSEPLLFQVGHAYQQITDWHTRRPQLV